MNLISEKCSLFNISDEFEQYFQDSEQTTTFIVLGEYVEELINKKEEYESYMKQLSNVIKNYSNDMSFDTLNDLFETNILKIEF